MSGADGKLRQVAHKSRYGPWAGGAQSDTRGKGVFRPIGTYIKTTAKQLSVFLLIIFQYGCRTRPGEVQGLAVFSSATQSRCIEMSSSIKLPSESIQGGKI